MVGGGCSAQCYLPVGSHFDVLLELCCLVVPRPELLFEARHASEEVADNRAAVARRTLRERLELFRDARTSGGAGERICIYCTGGGQERGATSRLLRSTCDSSWVTRARRAVAAASCTCILGRGQRGVSFVGFDS